MIGILHLSDIHISNGNNEILYMVNTINNAIKEQYEIVDKIIIIISGDIAFSGNESEYEWAYCFLEELRETIEKETEIILAPGNHDCLFESNNLRDQIIENIITNKNNISSEFIEICCSAQRNFFEFERTIENKNIKNIFKDDLFTIREIDIDTKKIIFLIINTAWISKLNEQAGEIFFPLEKYINEIEKCDEDSIIMSIFHHPSKWAHPDDSNYFDGNIEKYSDFIFTGHEHYAEKFKKISESSNVIYFKAEALQKDEGMFNSGFTYVNIDLNEEQYRYTEFDYINSKYVITKESDWTEYRGSYRKKNNLYKLKKDMKDFLNDIEMNLEHPKKQRLNIEDIFIYPDLEFREIKKEKEKIKYRVQNSYEILNEINAPIIIYGDYKYGKTILAKKIYLDRYKDKFIPIYMDINEMNKSKIINIDKYIEELYSNQYVNSKEKKYCEIDDEFKILIIDNMEKLNEFKINKYAFIKSMKSKISRIVAFGKSTLDIEEMIDDDIVKEINIQEYDMKKFGKKLRYDLIHKWNTINDSKARYEDEFIQKNKENLNKINILIGKNYIPSIPFYMLVILQASEAGNAHNFIDSSYGYYYEYLILQVLNRISNNAGEIDAINNFLIELSYILFKKEKTKISDKELKDFHTEFIKKYRLSPKVRKISNYLEFKNILILNNIFKNINNEYEFSYTYIYYYYIGRFLADNIEKEEIREKIEVILNNLYLEEYANIVIFIIYRNKNNMIFEKLLDISMNIFKDVELCELDKNMSFIKEFDDVDFKITIDNNNAVENIKKRYEEDDEIEFGNEIKNKEIIEYNEEQTKEMTEQIEFTKKVNLAVKLMEIKGQILKNYWGSLDGITKEAIGIQLYSLGLRVVTAFYNDLDRKKEKFLKEIKEELKNSKYNRETQLEKEIIIKEKMKKINFLLSTYITQSIIYKIADCVGDKNLTETYNDIYNKLKYNSVELINLGIDLEYSNGEFPFKKVQKLYHDNEKNKIAILLIKSMCREYIYMNKVSRSDIKKIIQLVSLDVREINLKKGKIEKENSLKIDNIK